MSLSRLFITGVILAFLVGAIAAFQSRVSPPVKSSQNALNLDGARVI